jgi:hypothetical protein
MGDGLLTARSAAPQQTKVWGAPNQHGVRTNLRSIELFALIRLCWGPELAPAIRRLSHPERAKAEGWIDVDEVMPASFHGL